MLMQKQARNGVYICIVLCQYSPMFGPAQSVFQTVGPWNFPRNVDG
uniref:Uncharacterized protein n=1 Tax=Lepeophtheirus salmonis TaxID=72036 RepID=A0A0K2TSS0_LEPSM